MKLGLQQRKRRSGPGRSDRKGISLPELLDLFPDENAARRWFENVRWKKGRFCPHCGAVGTCRVATEKPQPYRRPDCRGYFSVRTGTVMQASKLPLRKWAFGVRLMSTWLKDVSSMKLHRDLGITQKTAWMMAHKIRQGWLAASKGKLSGTVEADETYVGGLERNKHRDKRIKAGRGTIGKAVVAEVKSRKTNEVRAAVIASADKRSLHEFVEANVEPGSVLYTDELKSYNGLGDRFGRGRVTHSVGQYVQGKAHTNGIESFWAPLKRTHKGTYHKMSRKHLHRYVAEFPGRHNLRSKDTLKHMKLLVRGMDGRRLTWKNLTR